MKIKINKKVILEENALRTIAKEPILTKKRLFALGLLGGGTGAVAYNILKSKDENTDETIKIIADNFKTRQDEQAQQYLKEYMEKMKKMVEEEELKKLPIDNPNLFTPLILEKNTAQNFL